MVKQGAHPTNEDLLAFAHGNLIPERQDQVESHVETCDSCCEFLKAVPNDDFLERLRDHQPVDTIVAAPELDTSATAKDVMGRDEETGVPAELADHARYRVLGTLGAGGMGVVYVAEHRLMERSVALKVINRKLISNTAAIERFQAEVRAAAKLSHRNIVTAFDAEQAGDLHFLVMEYVDGVSLAELVKKHGPLPIKHACNYVMQAALGLQHAFEQGMVHRDIKPQNLMRTKEGRVKVLDFGLARLATAYEEGQASEGLTDEGVTLGTPDFIAPEQARDSRAADIRSDIYSLGCTLYYLLTARPPFPRGAAVEKILAHCEKTPDPVSKFRQDATPELIAVLERMMEKDPDVRFQTPLDVIDALRPFGSSSSSATASGATAETASGSATQANADLSAQSDDDPSLGGEHPDSHAAQAPGVVSGLPAVEPNLDWLDDDPLGTTANTKSMLQSKPTANSSASVFDATTVRFAAMGGGAVLALGILIAISGMFAGPNEPVGQGQAGRQRKSGPQARSDQQPQLGKQGRSEAGASASRSREKQDARGDGSAIPSNSSKPATRSGGATVLLVIPHRGYWYDDYAPLRKVLDEAGMQVVIGSSSTGTATSHAQDASQGKHKVDVDVAINAASPDAYDAVVFIGGATEEFTGHRSSDTYGLVRQMAASNKLVASLCKGNEVLARAGVLRGHRAAQSEYIPQDVLDQSGAEWTGSQPYVESGNIITGRHFRDAEVFAKAMVERL